MKLTDHERRVLVDLSGGWAEAVAKGIWSEEQNPIAGGAWNAAREAIAGEGLLGPDLITLTESGWLYVDQMLCTEEMAGDGHKLSLVVSAINRAKSFIGRKIK